MSQNKFNQNQPWGNPFFRGINGGRYRNRHFLGISSKLFMVNIKINYPHPYFHGHWTRRKHILSGSNQTYKNMSFCAFAGFPNQKISTYCQTNLYYHLNYRKHDVYFFCLICTCYFRHFSTAHLSVLFSCCRY